MKYDSISLAFYEHAWDCLMTPKHIVSLAVTLLLLFSLNSCSSGSKNLSELSSDADGQAEYLVSVGDRLRVSVWGEARLTGPVLVRDDGAFTMELIGDVPAADRTIPEITTEVTERLAEYIPAASVSISVVQSAPVRYFLSGAFVRPGEYRSEGRITFLQAIATGQGFAPFADDSSIILIRKTSQGEKRYRLNYGKVINGKQPNPILKNGDVIAVE